ncbi:OsmC family protein [Saprospiraceae bacterium]|nr:OsmC family protein [Saprospiraceae bacterium]
MKITLESTHGELNFKGTNERGQSIQLSGNKEACSPMETLLIAAAACSSIDIELILKKMRQDLQGISVIVEGDRRDGEVPAIFTKMNLHYIIKGDVKDKKAKEAVSLSLEKYCSVTQSLSSGIEITSSYEVQAID